MARPTTKKDLCEAAETQFQKLENLIDGMSEEEQKGTFLFEDRDKNLRDVLIHLY
ncbi:MAG: ClbS/DfsB family four-helix bundle protein, partial [Pseudoleptotrichia goodfellowii]|nr:ClbS/DfsB family four-helix bundle protein [Pseudoleptotrichia goodfellowii]